MIHFYFQAVLRMIRIHCGKTATKIRNAKHVSDQIVTPDDRSLNVYSVAEKRMHSVLLIPSKLKSKYAMNT